MNRLRQVAAFVVLTLGSVVMFKWSCGSTVWYSPFLRPDFSNATFAITSFAFMLVDVPAPPWYQSTVN